MVHLSKAIAAACLDIIQILERALASNAKKTPIAWEAHIVRLALQITILIMQSNNLIGQLAGALLDSTLTAAAKVSVISVLRTNIVKEATTHLIIAQPILSRLLRVLLPHIASAILAMQALLEVHAIHALQANMEILLVWILWYATSAALANTALDWP